MVLKFHDDRLLDAVMLGRLAIDFNPVDYPNPLSKCFTFHKYVGGSPANIAVGLARLGDRVGFVGRVSDDRFGDYVTEYFEKEKVDTSHIRRCEHGENLGLTFTEILSDTQSSILMYRNDAADLKLDVSDIDEDYLAETKILLVSGTALSASPSREAALKAILLAKKHDVRVIFDIDYRPQIWKGMDEVSLYYGLAASQADVVLGSRQEFDLAERLMSPGMTDTDSACFWFKKGASLIVIKHGREGSVAFASSGEAFRVHPFHVKQLKGFGGGDGYAAALIHGLLKGEALEVCLEKGSAEAAMLVAAPACSDYMPDEAKLEAFVEKGISEFGYAVERIQ